ncbi:MAG TPA: hypothetical protein VEO54_17780 [Thermoanaerobaculia bacterium]|nr:hypothetical protein [Thermoanaerobaculia bacterium]
MSRVEARTFTITATGETPVEQTIYVYDAHDRVAEISQNGPPATYHYEPIDAQTDRVTVRAQGSVVREFLRRTSSGGTIVEEYAHPEDIELTMPFEDVMLRMPGGRVLLRYAGQRLLGAEYPGGALVIEHDAHGRLTHTRQTLHGRTILELRRAYDDARREITISIEAEGTLAAVRRIRVDHTGRMLDEEMDFFGVSRRTEYRYTDNDRGDWIERIASQDGTPVVRATRDIVYR